MYTYVSVVGQGTHKTAICLLYTSPSGNGSEIWPNGVLAGHKELRPIGVLRSVNTLEQLHRIWKLFEATTHFLALRSSRTCHKNYATIFASDCF